MTQLTRQLYLCAYAIGLAVADSQNLIQAGWAVISAIAAHLWRLKLSTAAGSANGPEQ